MTDAATARSSGSGAVWSTSRSQSWWSAAKAVRARLDSACRWIVHGGLAGGEVFGGVPLRRRFICGETVCGF